MMEVMQYGKDSSNKDIAELLRQVASVYELNGEDLFRVRAYQNAANSVDLQSTALKELWEEGRLDEVPGLGHNLIEHLDELFRTGKVKHFEQVLRSQPAGFFSLLEVPGIGPKTAQKLTEQLGLKRGSSALEKVRAALRAGKLSGFSQKVRTRLLSALDRQRQNDHRLLISEAEHIAEDVMQYLRRSPFVLECEALGSLRRKAATIGDVDIAVSTHEPEKVMTYLRAFPHLKKIVSTGDKMTIFVHSSGLQVDLKTQAPQAWGSMLQHYTGSKLHNIHLRTLAKEKGLSLSENGVKKGNHTQQYKDEASFYQALGLEYIPPELREGRGEIEAAQWHGLPQLVERGDIKGDFHVHTSLEFPSSHDAGKSSIAELLHRAQELGYEYIGFADHNPKQLGLTPAERITAIRDRNTAIDHAVTEYTQHPLLPSRPIPFVFKGLEVDILPSGQLALEDAALSELDYAIASIHSQFTLPRSAMTQRILAGLAHPKVKILGHPTARRLGSRPEIECDWEEVFAFCAQHHILIEVNSAPTRLDLPDLFVKQALEQGVQFIINTDTHHVDHLDFMKYGVWVARRGWCEADAIINTHSLSQVQKWFTA